MRSMVERVARIVAIDMCDAWHRVDAFTLDEVNGDTLERARAVARAAIEEMREPTDAMMFAGAGTRNDWRAMIDAALQERDDG